MIEILNNHCNKQTGLLLFSPPTGSGKTFNVLKWIYDNYKDYCKDGKKIFFITNLKKNLPYEELKTEFFKPNKELKEFDKYVTFIDSNSECLINNFESIESSINEYFKNHKIFYTIKSTVNEINKHKNNPELRTYVNNIKNDLRNKYEPEFRRKIERFLKEDYPNRQERIEAIKKNEGLKWIGELYPAVFTSRKKILFLSIDKFYHKNSTLVEPSYSFLENDITKDAIIFIDEFDATKDCILNNIIDKGTRQRIDFIHLFTEIYWALSKNVFPKKFVTHSEKRKELIEKGYSLDLNNIHNILLEKANEIVSQYKLEYSFKSIGNDSNIMNQRNLLFHDFQYHSVYRNNKRFIRLNTNDNDKINEIIFEENKPESGNNIVSLLNQIKGFVNYFSGIIKSIAENYQQLETQEREKNPSKPEFTFDLALSTVLEEFNLESDYKRFINDNILNARDRNTRKVNGVLELNYDLSVYENGFRYYDFVDDDQHLSKTKTFIYSFQNTPEKFILKLSEKSKVIGISATALVKTVTGNYDIDYFKRQLGPRFIELSKHEKKQLSNLFQKQNKFYESININTEWLSFNGSDLDFERLFENKELADDIIGEIKSDNPKTTDYLLNRYLKISTSFKHFLIKDDIKGFLCLLNKEPKVRDNNLNLRIIEKIFDYLISETTKTKSLFIKEGTKDYSVRESYVIINSNDFDTKKQSFISKLEHGKKIFIISMYQTMGAGQNLHFVAPNPEDLVDVRDQSLTDWNKQKKTDINAIYLDKPTHLIQQISKDLNEEGFIRYLFQLEFLAQAGRISTKQLNQQVSIAFKYLLASFNTKAEIEKTNNGYLYQDENIKQHFSKYIIQAIGRICRTNLKSKNIYIYADKELENLIYDFDVDSNLVLNEFKALVKSSNIISKDSINNELKAYNNLANSTNKKVSAQIKKFINPEWEWKHKSIEEWINLRKMCLRFPTLTFEDIDKHKLYRILDMYIELPKEGIQYTYDLEGDYEEVDIDFKQELPFLVSEVSARLNELFEIPKVKSYFKEQNWATGFKAAKYILPPELFNNIYKGALGEEVGKFIFEHHFKIELEPLPEKYYEFFDFKIKNTNTYIDFKHWKESTKMSYEEQSEKIRNKLNKLQADNVFIINILSSSERRNISSSDKKIIEIPFLWNNDKKQLNQNVLNLLQQNEILQNK